MMDKWNFPDQFSVDKWKSGGEFPCVLALFSGPKLCEKEVPFKEGNAKFTCFLAKPLEFYRSRKLMTFF